MPNSSAAPGRVNQKRRTRAAIVEAARDLMGSGADVTMPEIARAALVSEATAYRYFPDLVSLLSEAMEGTWPSAAEALAPVAHSADPVERVAFATEYLLRRVHAFRGSVRAMISGTITRPKTVRARPGHRFGLIEEALAPLRDSGMDAGDLARLKEGLWVVAGAEAFFTLTDLCGLTPDEAVASAVRTASTLVRAALPAGPYTSGEASQ